MTTLDFLTAILLFGFLAGGYTSGLIQSAGSIVGLLLGVTLANKWYVAVGGFVQQFVGGQEALAKIIAYALIVLIVSRLFGIAVAIFLKLFKILTIVPGLKTMDKLGGTILGFLEGSLLVGLSYSTAAHILGPSFQHQLDISPLSKFIQHIGVILLPLVPKALKEVQAITPPMNMNVNASAAVNSATTFQGALGGLIDARESLPR